MVESMIRYLILLSLIIPSIFAQKNLSKPPVVEWLTLSGKEPVVVARGGFSGLFPYGSSFAIDMAMTTSMGSGEVVMYCDVQFTKDGTGICQPSPALENTTSIETSFPKGERTYKVYGKDMTGWFAVDYTAEELFKDIALMQSRLSRPDVFDGQLPISSIDDVLGRKDLAYLWLNIQYDAFYRERKQSPTDYVLNIALHHPVNYISSPEIGMLKAIKVDKTKTKLIFQFLGLDELEPSTNRTYRTILKDLTSVKDFAVGILVPKTYVMPVGPENYLKPATTLVTDAHKLGLEVYTHLFANDISISYNYSFDPIQEYLRFVDNSDFAVDGFLTDFSPTAVESIVCFAHGQNETRSPEAKALIISHNGASGTYPGCTDLAYKQAVADGADVIDCSVQMSKDGVAFCMGSPDLSKFTTAMTSFMSKSATIPEIQPKSGIFSFDLTWSEIQTLKPQLTNLYSYLGYPRDLSNKNKGKFTTLTEFLEFAEMNVVRGILIKIEQAAYLASKKGLDVVGAVTSALSNTMFGKEPTEQVLMMSDDTSVLSRFPTYKRLLYIHEIITEVPKASVDEVKKYVDGVVIRRESTLPTTNYFLSRHTSVVHDFQAANLSVYVSYLRNEFLSLPFDYFNDPTAQFATLIAGYRVDGVFTDFPATGVRYMNSRCYDIEGPQAILPTQPGSLLELVEGAQPPAKPPAPLEVDDVADPPLPPVVAQVPPPTASPPDSKPSGALSNASSAGFSLAAVLVLQLLLS